MEGYRNKIDMRNTDGELRKAPIDNLHGELSTHIIAVDSRDRNRSVWANANSFRIEFPTPYANVVSIELRRAIFGVPAAAATEPYAILRIGEHSSRMERAITPGRSNTTSTGTPGQDRPLDATWGNPATDQAFGVLPIRITTGMGGGGGVNLALWEAGSKQVIAKRYYPMLSVLKNLHIQVFTRGNVSAGAAVPYPFVADSAVSTDPTVPERNIYLEFEVKCQS